MTDAHKLRVATADHPAALSLVRAEVAGALGVVPGTDLQELDGGEVVVELSLPCRADLPATPADLARLVRRWVGPVEVLGAWRQRSGAGASACRAGGDVVVPHRAAEDPVAARAMVDGVPTAAWQSAERRWTLGVPRVLGDGSLRVVVARRGGYHARFTDADVAAHLRLLVAA